MMTTTITRCRIWGEDYEAVGQRIADPSKDAVTNSDRAGGGYVIPGSVGQHLDELEGRAEGSTHDLAGGSAIAGKPPSHRNRGDCEVFRQQATTPRLRKGRQIVEIPFRTDQGGRRVDLSVPTYQRTFKRFLRKPYLPRYADEPDFSGCYGLVGIDLT